MPQSLVKKCRNYRRCLWRSPYRETDLEAKGAEPEVPTNLLRSLLGGASTLVSRGSRER